MTRQVRLRALNEHTTGLALAGDGARGAAFAVGFLQGLASLALIRRIDYLSAELGGGAAAAWLAAWLKREGGDPRTSSDSSPRAASNRRGQHANISRSAKSSTKSHSPCGTCDLYSGALDPRAGILSTDDWTSICKLGAKRHHPLAGGRAAARAHRCRCAGSSSPSTGFSTSSTSSTSSQRSSTAGWARRFLSWASSLSGSCFWRVPSSWAAGVLVDCRVIARLSPSRPPIAAASRAERCGCPGQPPDRDPDSSRRRSFLALCLPPIWRGLRSLIEDLRSGPNTVGCLLAGHSSTPLSAHFTLLGWPNFLAHALFIGGRARLVDIASLAGEERARTKKVQRCIIRGGCDRRVADRPARGAFSLVRPARSAGPGGDVSSAAGALDRGRGVVVAVALSGRAAGDAERAWWAASSALLVETGDLLDRGDGDDPLSSRRHLRRRRHDASVIAAAWLGAAAFGVLDRPVFPGRTRDRRCGWLSWLASLAAQVFFVGLLGATALFVSLLANMPSLSAPGGDDVGPFAYYLQGVEGTSLLALLVIADRVRPSLRPGTTARSTSTCFRSMRLEAARLTPLLPGRLAADARLACALVGTARPAQ